MSIKRLFILGGEDAEMATIKQLLNQQGEHWVQPQTKPGAPYYSPADVGLEIDSSDPRHTLVMKIDDHNEQSYHRQAWEPIFVESFPDGNWPKEITPFRWGNQQPLTVIDHHNQRASEPASIVQVIRLLDCWGKLSPATQRWVELIAANDTDYIPGMARIGATPEEISRVRALDGAILGITKENRRQAFLRSTEDRYGCHHDDYKRYGRLTIIHRLPHNKCAAVTDQLHDENGSPQYDQLLIHSEWRKVPSGETLREVNFFGDGAVCNQLKEKYGGWGGGSGFGKAGVNAYWGTDSDPGNDLVEFLKNHPNIKAPASRGRLSQ